ncbi:P-loop containing nucleoside triphosphate hydrolase protein, partial [Lasiosphaeris hirsuta]
MAPVVADSASRPDAQAQEENRNYVKIEDLNLVLMSPLLHAFSFESKKWIAINVDFVSPVQFDGSINRHLVADEEDKEMLHSLVARHSRVAQGLEDPILQKGIGLVVLLSGPPGTGKTLMAEAIAEKAKRPLYCVDTRDLGSEYKSISKYFQRIMENAAEWNAIVLLDEAEMFLQRRNTKARDSNEKVTAFLRCLEHVQGILFMTTNFPEALDVAVESRIHIHITVDRPSLNKRKRIWDHFLEKLPSLGRNHTLSDADRVTLASWAINGRQIKNSFRMSLSVRESKTEPITLRDLERMIRMSCPVAKK